jgi:hypothetical protein
MATMLCPRCWGATTDPTTHGPCPTCSARGAVPDQTLSAHFRLSELLASPTAVRNAIANEPDAAQLGHLQRLCTDLLELVRGQFGALHVNSGLRVPALNARIAGHASQSAHMYGWAADIVPSKATVKLKTIVDWVIASTAKYDQVIYEGTWVHLALFHPDGVTQRRQALMMFSGASGAPVYTAYDPADARVQR